jgi:hypothetical protein
MKLSKYEAIEYRKKKHENDFKGEGLFVFRNANKADLMLPKPAKNGVKMIGPGKEFQGDSFFMEMVKTNQLRLVKTLITPEQERGIMTEEKLILDQPETITTQGTVEHVVSATPVKPLNEQEKSCCGSCGCGGGGNKEVLINEDPLEGVDILD